MLIYIWGAAVLDNPFRFYPPKKNQTNSYPPPEKVDKYEADSRSLF